MTNADLRGLLREARDTLDSEASTPEELDFVSRIDAALAGPVEEIHAACGRVHRNGAVCILETVLLIRERTAERDEARAEVERLRAALAVHEAEGAVRWISYGPYHAKSVRVGNFELTVTAHGINGPWHWEAPRTSGYEPTFDAAKAAAERAAKEQGWGQR